MEMTGRARLDAVAAGLHVPEERFSESDGGRFIRHELNQVFGFGNGNGLQGRQRLRRIPGGHLCPECDGEYQNGCDGDDEPRQDVARAL
jgi:hypothetical protein